MIRIRTEALDGDRVTILIYVSLFLSFRAED